MSMYSAVRATFHDHLADLECYKLVVLHLTGERGRSWREHRLAAVER